MFAKGVGEREACKESNVSWIRNASSTETLAGRVVKAWVCRGLDAQQRLRLMVKSSPLPTEQRVLVGNRALMVEEGVAMTG